MKIESNLLISFAFDITVYAGSSDTSSRMYEAKSGSHKRSFHGHENSITCLEVSVIFQPELVGTPIELIVRVLRFFRSSCL